MRAMRLAVVLVAVWLLAGSLSLAAEGELVAAGLDPQTRIAYMGTFVPGERGIRLMMADGSQPVDLPAVPGAGRDKITPALSADGSKLAFAAQKDKSLQVFVWDLSPNNETRGVPRQITKGRGDYEQPAFSHDGTRLAYVFSDLGKHGLYVMKADGSESHKVADLTAAFRNACPRWSPDDANLLFAKDTALWVARADGREAKLIKDQANYGDWSPNGQRIAYVQRGDTPDTSSLWVMNTDGGGAVQVVAALSGAGQALWSPDGEWIAFKALKVGTREGKHWKVRPNGQDLEALRTQGEPAAYLAWAPVAPAPVVAVAPAEPTPVTPAEVAQGPVKITSPDNGQEVRGEVKITVQSDEPAQFVTFHIMPATSVAAAAGGPVPPEGASFRYATAAPFEFGWDTRTERDGEAVITTSAFNEAGAAVGSSTVRVKVANQVQDPVVQQQGVILEIRFAPQQVLRYTVKGKGELSLPGNAAPSEQLKRLNCEFNALLTRTAESVDPQHGTATLRNKLRRGLLTAGDNNYPMPEEDVYARTTITAQNWIAPLRVRTGGPSDQTRLDLATICLELSNRPVRIGEKWNSRMSALDDLLTRTAAITTTEASEIERLEWAQDLECARIKTTFKLPSGSIPVLPSVPALSDTGEVTAASPGMTGVEPVPMATPITTYGTAGWGTAAGSVAPGATIQTATGTRTTWVAYKTHQVVRMEDTIKATLNVPADWVPSTATAGTGAGTGGYGPSGYGPSAYGTSPYTGGYYGGYGQPRTTQVTYTITFSMELIPEGAEGGQ